MAFIISVSRYALPAIALIFLSKCILTLLLGNPREKIYGYITDLQTRESHPLNMWETSLGRAGTNDIVLDYDTVSRAHGVITRRIDGWYIYDLNSKGGIKLNGKPFKEKSALSHGDLISLAGVMFRFEIADDPVIKAKKGKGRQSAPQKTPPARKKPTVPRQPGIYNRRTGQTTMLYSTRIYMGRSSRNDLRVMGSGVARRHCCLVLYEDGWAIEDLGAGTLLNSKKITSPQLLFDGDVITIGSESFVYKSRVL